MNKKSVFKNNLSIYMHGALTRGLRLIYIESRAISNAM